MKLNLHGITPKRLDIAVENNLALIDRSAERALNRFGYLLRCDRAKKLSVCAGLGGQLDSLTLDL